MSCAESSRWYYREENEGKTKVFQERFSFQFQNDPSQLHPAQPHPLCPRWCKSENIQTMPRCPFMDLIPVLIFLMLFFICLSVTIAMNKCMQQTRGLAAWEGVFACNS